MKKTHRLSYGYCTGILFAFFLFTGIANCEKKSEGAALRPGVNFFSAVLSFPDKNANVNVDEAGLDSGDDTETPEFFKRSDAAYQATVKARGGYPVTDTERQKLDRDMAIARAEILFDMRLGEKHTKKKEFLEIAGYTFDKRIPIQARLDPAVIQKEHRTIPETEKLVAEEFERLLIDVKAKYAAIFNDADYDKMMGEKKN